MHDITKPLIPEPIASALAACRPCPIIGVAAEYWLPAIVDAQAACLRGLLLRKYPAVRANGRVLTVGPMSSR
jgi:hypothetical protein